MLQLSTQIQSKCVRSPSISTCIPIQIHARGFHIIFMRIANHGGLSRIPIGFQIFHRSTQVLNHATQHIVFLDVLQDLISTRWKTNGHSFEERRDVTR